MNDKELYDLFHAYRPELDDDDALLARLAKQMDATDEQQHPRVLPLCRRMIPRKIAAVFLGVLLATGLTFAAFFAAFLFEPSDETSTTGGHNTGGQIVENARPAAHTGMEPEPMKQEDRKLLSANSRQPSHSLKRGKPTGGQDKATYHPPTGHKEPPVGQAETSDSPQEGGEPVPIPGTAAQSEPPAPASPIPADKQALADIYLAEAALQVAYKQAAVQKAVRAYQASITGDEPAQPIIAF